MYLELGVHQWISYGMTTPLPPLLPGLLSPVAACTLPVLQLEVQGVRRSSAWLRLSFQQAAGTGQVLALAGHVQGCVTMSVLQRAAGPFQHEGLD